MLSVVLSAHTLLIAAIFVPYVTLMTGLGVYIWSTGRPGHTNEPDDTGDTGEPALGDLPVAA